MFFTHYNNKKLLFIINIYLNSLFMKIIFDNDYSLLNLKHFDTYNIHIPIILF